MVTAMIDRITSWPAVSIAGGLLALSIVTNAAVEQSLAQIWYSLLPVAYDWQPEEPHAEGTAGVVTGTFKRRWACTYRYPPLARDVRTGRLLVVESRSAAKLQNFPPSRDAYPFGPWVVADGAGRCVSFTLYYVCGGSTDVFSTLGSVCFPS